MSSKKAGPTTGDTQLDDTVFTTESAGKLSRERSEIPGADAVQIAGYYSEPPLFVLNFSTIY